MTYLYLFWSFFQVGLFSFGGGYAAMPLIKNQVVDVHGWLTINEFADVITISQMTPGPIGINSSTFVGIQIAGPLGAIVATIGCVLPSCIIVLLLAYIYYRYRGLSTIQGILKGLRPAVIAMIASSGLSILMLVIWKEDSSKSMHNVDIISVLIFIAGLFVLRKWKVNPIKIMLGAGVIGGFLFSIL